MRTSPVRTIVSCGLMVAGLFGVTNCTSHIPTACAGECAAPYQLQVGFKSRVSSQTAHAALSLCGTNPIVLKVDKIQASGRGFPLGVTIYTRTGPSSTRTASFLKCLESKAGPVQVGLPG
jgi:hypothetical protein